MKLGLRIKIVGIVGFALAVMLFFWSYKDLKTLKTQYLQTVQAHAEVMAQFLVFLAQGELAEGYTKQYVLDVEQHGAKLPEICQKVLTVNPNKRAIYVAVISARKTLIAHSDPKQTDLHIRDTRALDQIGGYKISTAFDADRGTLDLFIPTFNLKNEYIGVINIGFSSREALAQFAKWKQNAISIDLLFLGIACLIILIIIDLIVTRPIKYLIKIGERLAEGYPIHSLTMTERGDEIALLSRVFVQTSDYLQEITGIAQNVATGALAHDVRKRSKRDALGVALQDMLSYLQTLAEIGSRIARGDLTSMPFLRSDIDAFGRAMRDMTVGLQSLIQQIRVSAEQISGTGLNLATLSDNDMDIVQSTQSAVDQMISTMTQMGQSVEEVAHNMDVLSTSVEETSASVSNMTRSISNIAANTGDLATETQKAITELHKSTELLKNVTEKTVVSRQLSQETIQDALKGQQSMEEVTSSMDTIQRTNSSAVETITHFEQQTQDIGTILDVIDEITDQSSLLALNASIIAAQAGTHGRGFAVIADEMRNLATKVFSSTKDISAIVKVVQEETKTVVKKIHESTHGIAQGVKRTEQARNVLQNIFTSAQRSSTVVSDIADAIQKMQETTSRQLRSVMERVNNMTEEIMKATMEQKASTIQIDQTVEHIAKMAVQTQHATTEQLQGVRQVLEAVEQLRSLSDKNLESSLQIEQTADALSEQARILLQSVDRFKLGKTEIVQSSAVEKPAAMKTDGNRPALR